MAIGKSIDDMHQLEKSRGFLCLSDTYINAHMLLKWQCPKGHIWEAKPSHIKNTWCPTCALDKIGDATRLTLADIQKMTKFKGRKCLSDTNINSRILMNWQCELGHIWKAKADRILAGYWCHICYGKQQHDLESVQEFFKSKGGLCLSKVYKNNRNKLKWQFSEGHTWESSFQEVKDGNSWCPHCFKFYSEEKVRFIIESIFHKPFRKNRTALGENLELDGYNEELLPAFEYHGKQHYVFDPFYYKSHKELEKRKQLDLKRRG